MFAYPQSTAFNRVVPKNKIYAHTAASKRLKTLFAAQVAELFWAHKLSSETLHLPAAEGIEEIQVFRLVLKNSECDPAILRLIDQAIPHPLLFELLHGDHVRFAASYKRPSAAAAGKWVIEATFLSHNQPASTPRRPLPVAIDLARLHEQLLRPHIPLPARAGETLGEQVVRHTRLLARQTALRQLEARLDREKQFNRKVELNSSLRELRKEIGSLLA